MNITQLTYFKYVVDEMSVTKAAQKLFVTQSAVSQQINLLATELECQLFYRRGRLLQLTSEGEFLYQKAKNILTQMEGIGDELKSRGGNVVGNVKIGSGPVISKKLLPDVVSNMLKTYPDVSFSLFEIHSANQVKSIIGSQIDLGVGQIREENIKINWERLITGRFVIICSSQSKWSSLQTMSLRDLPKHNLIRRVPETEGNSSINVLAPDSSWNFQLEAMNTETIVPYVQHGMGIALAPNYIIDLMAPEGICQIELKEETYTSMGVIWDKFRPLPKAAQVFIDMLKQKLQK